ncbi:hypothetical protein I7I48_02954 [Histoplasma ohiense]|nr:hypothetical protein I7I48_02954 [Histoplasma ohiense (nom. inval.)]
MASDSDDPELKLELDLMTLDYLLHKAIIAVIDDRIEQRRVGEQSNKNGDSILGIFDACMQLFRYNHLNNNSRNSNYESDRNNQNNNTSCFPIDLRIKLQILTVTNLLCRRYHQGSRAFLPSEETLQAQKKGNRERAEHWLRQNEDHRICRAAASTPVMNDSAYLERNRRDMYVHMGIPCKDGNDNIPVASLLDILPECMSLCGMVCHHDIPDTSWMELPVRFMLFAAIEEILLHGTMIEEAANEAFAWDYPYKVESDDHHDEDCEQDDKARIAQWESVRDSVKTSLVGVDGERGWETSIGEILEKCPFIRFEEYVMEWLVSLLRFQKSPILMQLEEGKLEGLTLEETAAFMSRVGI